MGSFHLQYKYSHNDNIYDYWMHHAHTRTRAQIHSHCRIRCNGKWSNKCNYQPIIYVTGSRENMKVRRKLVCTFKCDWARTHNAIANLPVLYANFLRTGIIKSPIVCGAHNQMRICVRACLCIGYDWSKCENTVNTSCCVHALQSVCVGFMNKSSEIITAFSGIDPASACHCPTNI